MKNYESENPGVKIKINSGGSGTLEQQITGGAPVDIFLSASKKNMDNLEEKGFLRCRKQSALWNRCLSLMSFCLLHFFGL